MFSDSLESDWKLNFERNSCSRLIEHSWTRAAYDDVKIMQVVLKLNDRISCDAIRAILHFIYTGDFTVHVPCSYEVGEEILYYKDTKLYRVQEMCIRLNYS